LLGKYKEVGSFDIDLTYLRGENRVKEIVPGENEKGKHRYKVEYDLVLEAIDRNLFYHAQLVDDNRVLEGSQGLVSIAAAFHPGTK
jgi:hypothetical protein